MNNKGADQTARMHRLICAFVVRTWQKQVSSWRGSFIPFATFPQILPPNTPIILHRLNPAKTNIPSLTCLIFSILSVLATISASKAWCFCNFLILPCRSVTSWKLSSYAIFNLSSIQPSAWNALIKCDHLYQRDENIFCDVIRWGFSDRLGTRLELRLRLSRGPESPPWATYQVFRQPPICCQPL